MPPTDKTTYLTGLDLGQLSDPSALAVCEQTTRDGKKHYGVRHLHRWQLGTSYPNIVADVVKMFRRPPLSGSTLLVDATGVGKAVVEMFRTSSIDALITPVTITGGLRPSHARDGWHVPKKDLVGAMQVVLGTRRIDFADLPLTRVLRKELENFKVKVSAAGDESFEAWRSSQHDDLVLALALAVWYAEKARPLAPLRTLTLSDHRGKGTQLRVVICSGEQLAALEAEQPALLISVQDPPTVGLKELPSHGLKKLLGSLVLLVADVEPEEFGHRWDVPLVYRQPSIDR